MVRKSKRIPKTRYKVVANILSQSVSDAKSFGKGKSISEGNGPFGESRELLAFEILHSEGEEMPKLTEAALVHERLQNAFLDNLAATNIEDLLDCLTLCLYGLILEKYDDEDFRYLYWYVVANSKEYNRIEEWLRRGLVFLAACRNKTEKDLLHEIWVMIRFLGARTFSPSLLESPCTDFGIDIKAVLDNENTRLVDSIMRHPEYLEEAAGGKSYSTMRAATSEWLPDVLSSKLLSIYSREIHQEAQGIIESKMNVTEAIESIRAYFKQQEFCSTDDSVFPVRLHHLPSPPPAEAIEPVVFEMIPQKLRKGLLPAVAYSSKTKNIEIIFLGGPRIGRSGILIKIDTGGILLDFGLSVANQRIPDWVPELEMIDTVLISHAHLDHVGGLPILYETYQGKWCSVGHTGAITMALLEDAYKIGTPLPPRRRDRLDMVSRFNHDNIEKVSKNHVQLELGKTSEVGPGILVTPVDACHIPGSVSYLVDIEGKKILYTGDFNTDASVLFPGAILPTDCDVVIFDGTYWDRIDFNRDKVTEQIRIVVDSYGPIVIPSFAVGRSQEILMILENLGTTRRKDVLVAGLAERVTKQVGIDGHWKGIKKSKTTLEKDDIIVAGGGMMGGGLARQYFNEQRQNSEAAIILCGYLAPRTPGWNLLHGYEPHDCHVEYARLSAHSSSSKLQELIRSYSGKKVIVHTPAQSVPRGVMMPDYKERILLRL